MGASDKPILVKGIQDMSMLATHGKAKAMGSVFFVNCVAQPISSSNSCDAGDKSTPFSNSRGAKGSLFGEGRVWAFIGVGRSSSHRRGRMHVILSAELTMTSD